MTQAAIEAIKAAMQAISEAAGPTNRNNAVVTTPSMITRSCRSALKQLTFNLNAQDGYKKE